MILPLRKKGERTQPHYLTEIPVGKVCPSSLGVCSPPAGAVWEESGSGHGGLHLVVVLGVVTKSKYLLTFSSIPCPSPGSLGCSSSDTWQRLAEVEEAEAWFGSSHIPHAILGMRNLGRLNLTSPGEDRGKADWAAEGATCS